MLLIIGRSRSHAEAIAEMFNIMGIGALAATPRETLSEISLIYRAAIIISPDSLPEPSDFMRKLLSYNSSIPLFGITDSCSDYGMLAGIFPKTAKAYDIAYFISEYQKKNNLPIIGDYRLAGFNAIASEKSVAYFDTPLPFTKTESMILRYLIRSYPLPQSSKSILKHSFRPSRRPDESCIRTHISKMNSKFKRITNRNAIIHREAEGYLLLTPEIIDGFL